MGLKAPGQAPFKLCKQFSLVCPVFWPLGLVWQLEGWSWDLLVLDPPP